MENIKHKILMILTMIILTAFLSSCATTKTSVGNFREKEGSEYTYSKGKQWWLFWGILPVGRTSLSTPTDGSCQVITRYNIIDFLISGLTIGILTTETIKVIAKK